jgi:hypothetical protein
MPLYNTLNPPVLNPRNAGQIIDATVNRAYQLSGGNLRNFLPGSPFMVLVESLCFAYLELAHWTENLPEAYIITLMDRLLAQGSAAATFSSVTVTVALTGALPSNFFIAKGAVLLDKNDGNNQWLTTEDLNIAPGQLIGTVNARAAIAGSSTNVQAGALNAFSRNFAYVNTVSNSAASTIGVDAETSFEAQDRIKNSLAQRNYSSEEDWQNLVVEYFGFGTKSRALRNPPSLDIFIKGLVPGPTLVAFQAEVLKQRSLLQQVFIKPYEAIGLELLISYTDSTPLAEECVKIATELNTFVQDFIGAPQPVDLYQQFVQITGNSNLADFQVKAYDLGIKFYNKPLQSFSFNSGQIVKDRYNNYFQGSADTHVVNSAFDDAELGLLNYYPVLETFSGGFVEAGYIVKFGSLYYKINSSGQFTAGSPNVTLLTAPQTWAFNTSYNNTDFLRVGSPSSAFSHGFVPDLGSYTTATDWQNNLVAIVPLSKQIGDNISTGEVWFLASQPQVVYVAANNFTLTAAVLPTLIPEQIAKYPESSNIDHWLSHHSQYRIGTITLDENFVYVNSNGTKKAIPPGIITNLFAKENESYGSLFLENNEIWEFTTGFLPTGSSTAATLPVKKATRLLNEFSFISYPEVVPYFLKLSSVAFLRGFANDPEKLAIEISEGVYAVSQ